MDRCLNGMLPWFWLSFLALAAWVALNQWQKPHAAAWLLLTALFMGGGAWGQTYWHHYAADEIGRFAPLASEPVCLTVEAKSSARQRAAPAYSPYRAIPGSPREELVVEVVAIRDRAEWRTTSGSCILSVNRTEDHLNLQHIRPGDHLRVFAQLARIAPATNPGQFDYAKHARADRQLCRLRATHTQCVKVLQTGSPWNAHRWVDKAQRAVRSVIENQLDETTAPLAAALLLGAVEGITSDQLDAFKRTGAVHVLVVSGLHVGLVAAAFYLIARLGLLRRQQALLLVMLLVAAYAVLVGGRAPVLRAAVLAEAVCLALITGRKAIAYNGLAAAMLVVLAWNPAELFRTGPQLSFLAAATLVWWAQQQNTRDELPPIERLIRSARPRWRLLGDGLMNHFSTLAKATTGVLVVSGPLLLSQYHLVTPVAVPLSLLLFPLVSVAVTAGMGMLVLGMLWEPLAIPAAWLCDTSVSGLMKAVEFCDSLPGSSFWSPSPASWWVAGWFALLGLVLYSLGNAKRLRRYTVLTTAWLALGAKIMLWSSLPAASNEGLRCRFLDVGHGVCVLIQTSDGHSLLYDAGAIGGPDGVTETISSVLWHEGIRHLDGVILSHADVDHFNALPGLLERFSVGTVYTSSVMFPRTLLAEDRAAPSELLRLLQRTEIPVEKLQLGDRLKLGRAQIEILAPGPIGVIGSDNANSLVVGLEYASRKILLTGDLEDGGLDAMLTQEPYDCDILLAPHHGSRLSNPAGLAAWCQPEWVVVSSGHKSDTRSIEQQYHAYGSQMRNTANCGAINFSITSEGVSMPRCVLSPN